MGEDSLLFLSGGGLPLFLSLVFSSLSSPFVGPHDSLRPSLHVPFLDTPPFNHLSALFVLFILAPPYPSPHPPPGAAALSHNLDNAGCCMFVSLGGTGARTWTWSSSHLLPTREPQRKASAEEEELSRNIIAAPP